MTTLNAFCQNDVSDEDCFKCMKYGIIFRCPSNCEYFNDTTRIDSDPIILKKEEGANEDGRC